MKAGAVAAAAAAAARGEIEAAMSAMKAAAAVGSSRLRSSLALFLSSTASSMATCTQGLACIAPHVIGCHSTQEARAQNGLDDVAINMLLALPARAHTRGTRRPCTSSSASVVCGSPNSRALQMILTTLKGAIQFQKRGSKVRWMTAALGNGPRIYCSPHHRLPFNSMNDQ